MLQTSTMVTEVLGLRVRPAALSSLPFETSSVSHCCDLKALPEPTPPYPPGALEYGWSTPSRRKKAPARDLSLATCAAAHKQRVVMREIGTRV